MVKMNMCLGILALCCNPAQSGHDSTPICPFWLFMNDQDNRAKLLPWGTDQIGVENAVGAPAG